MSVLVDYENILSSRIKRYITERSSLSEVKLELAFQEFNKFFLLAGLFEEKSEAPISDEIDEIWHYAILHTREYKKMCFHLHGRFIHHSPGNFYNEQSDEEKVNGHFSWGASYYRAFGPFESNVLPYWPAIDLIVGRLGLDRTNKIFMELVLKQRKQ